MVLAINHNQCLAHCTCVVVNTNLQIDPLENRSIFSSMENVHGDFSAPTNFKGDFMS